MTDGREGDSLRERRLGRIGRAWRNIVPVIALGLALWSVTGTQSDVDRTREGRHVAINVLCGGIRGVEDAGVAILKQQLPGVENPPASERVRRLRETYARAYAGLISAAVTAQAGPQLRGVLEPDGRLNCSRLIVASAANPAQ